MEGVYIHRSESDLFFSMRASPRMPSAAAKPMAMKATKDRWYFMLNLSGFDVRNVDEAARLISHTLRWLWRCMRKYQQPARCDDAGSYIWISNNHLIRPLVIRMCRVFLTRQHHNTEYQAGRQSLSVNSLRLSAMYTTRMFPLAACLFHSRVPIALVRASLTNGFVFDWRPNERTV